MFNIFKTEIEVREADPKSVAADGLVIPANDHLWMGSGLGGEVKTAGGEEIEVEAVRQGPSQVGSAVPTGAGSLPFKRVYHAVIMGQDLKVQAEKIPAALADALKQARQDTLESLAIAPLESEELVGPFREVAQRVVDALFDSLAGKTTLRQIVLAVGKPEAIEAYREAFFQALRGPNRPHA